MNTLTFALLMISQLVSPEEERAMRESFPVVADAKLQEVFDSPRTLLYTHDVIKPAYQVGGQFVSVRDNVGTDGNFRFPWSEPGGMGRVKNAQTFKFVWLPEGKPIVWDIGRLDSRDKSDVVTWIFPTGAIVGEVMTQRIDAKDYVFEVRTRTKERDDWGIEVYRPYPTAASLVEAIRLARPGWATDARLSSAIVALESRRQLEVRRLVDSRNDRPVLGATAGVFNLPSLDRELVKELLSNATFEPCNGIGFKSGAHAPSFASQDPKAVNIVPRNYDGTFMGVDRVSCLKCHETAGVQQRRFDDDWTGHVRGSDGIFSFRPGTIRDGKFVPRPELVASGHVARKNASHVDADYTLLRFIGEKK